MGILHAADRGPPRPQLSAAPVHPAGCCSSVAHGAGSGSLQLVSTPPVGGSDEVASPLLLELTPQATAQSAVPVGAGPGCCPGPKSNGAVGAPFLLSLLQRELLLPPVLAGW